MITYERTMTAKARRLIAAELKALRPSYAEAEAEIMASHRARGWVVRS